MNDYLNKPHKIQFELSSMCNALCLGCVRTDTRNFNQAKPLIPKKQIVEVDTFVKLISSEEMSSVKVLEFCGTIDDPLMHPDFLELLERAYEINPNYKINIHTNASLRNEADFEKLAHILKKFSEHELLFSIDGLGETHSIYRQFTNYDKIIANAKAYINAGGRAVWQFLIFPWNEHQVEEAKQISKELGFAVFLQRHDRSIATGLGLEKIKGKKQKNTLHDIVEEHSMDQLLESYENINSVEIACNNQEKGMYFVSFDSKLWPCCFIPNGFLQQQPRKVEYLHKRLYETYGKDFNDLTKKSIKEIVNNDFYKNDLVESWNNPVALGKCGKITRCAETCNVAKLKTLPIGKPKVHANV